jgi:transposase, IS30 family
MAGHLTFEERRLLDRLFRLKRSKEHIAELLGRHRSTIYRELARNAGPRGYWPKEAQRLAQKRRLASRRRRKMDDPRVHRYVQDRLEKRWSPEQIAGRAARDFPRAPARWLSRQTIYDWIADEAPLWRSLLRHGSRSLELRGKLKDCVRLVGRPDVINRKRRYGDWEGDTIVGQDRKSALLTLVERKSGYARIGRVEGMKSATTMRTATRRLERLPQALRRSVTFDNGKEFAEHRRLTARLGLEIYFADPYAAWQRGANENLNGLLRQFFPKGTDFARIGHGDVARVERLLNERPRKRLGFRTPAEILHPRICRN